MISKHALPPLALLLSACASKAPAPQPIPALAEATPVPRLPAPADGAAETSGKDGLPQPDALIATEQAIQLDELIKWVRISMPSGWTTCLENRRQAAGHRRRHDQRSNRSVRSADPLTLVRGMR